MANPNRAELGGKLPLPGSVTPKPYEYKPTTSKKANERIAEKSRELGVRSNGFGFATSVSAPAPTGPIPGERSLHSIKPVPAGHQFEPAIRPRLSPEAKQMRQARMDHADQQREIAAAKNRARSRNLFNNE